jgi:hypothetical protein
MTPLHTLAGLFPLGVIHIMKALLLAIFLLPRLFYGADTNKPCGDQTRREVGN